MGSACTICAHPKRAAIDLMLLNGGSVRITAATFGFDDFSAMGRHRRNHLPGVLAKVALQTEAQVRAEMRPDMDAVLNALWALYQQLDVQGRQLCLATIEQLENNQDGVPGVTAGKFTVSHSYFVIKGLQWPINRSDAAGLAGQYGDMPLSV
jgi:hypothetical protein